MKNKTVNDFFDRTASPKSKKELSEFGLICKLAKVGGYTVDDALFMYGLFKLVEEKISEDDIDQLFGNS